MDNSTITDNNRIEFNSYEEFIDFCNNLNSDMDLIFEDLDVMLENLMATEDFTRQQKRNFLASDLKQDDMQTIRLYRNRLFVNFKNVDYREPEYAENDITDLNVVYYFETKTWHFAY